MRIQNSTIAAISNYSAASKAREKSKTEAHEQLDSVQLSDNAMTFAGVVRKIKANAGAQSEAYTARVDEVAGQVEAGTYQIDPRKIAASMLNI